MKMLELRHMQDHELVNVLEDKIEALFNLRFQQAKRVLLNTNMIKQTKKDIAQIKTLLNEKKRGLNVN